MEFEEGYVATWGEVTELESGQMLRHHAERHCFGTCCLHGTGIHAVCRFPRSWRVDRGILEHHCPHGVGHPCPGSMDTTHGCDGCCTEVEGFDLEGEFEFWSKASAAIAKETFDVQAEAIRTTGGDGAEPR